MIMATTSTNLNITTAFQATTTTTTTNTSSQSSNTLTASAIVNLTETAQNETSSSSSSSSCSQPTNDPSTPSSSSASALDADIRWIFSEEKIQNSPSRLDGLTPEQELNERQQAALFISDLGSSLRVNQLCKNTAIIYMHRFFMIHSFKKFHRYVRMVAASCLFLSCKVEEQPRRLKEFIDGIQNLFHKSNETVTYSAEEFRKYGEEIVMLESCLLQTLGFNVLINHAQTCIIKTCQMIRAPRDLAEAAYLTATNSLILTNFCVKYSSQKIACFCIYLACKWTSLIIPTSSEGLQWYQYVKRDIVEQELEDISQEYLAIYDKCLPMIQKKLGKTRSTDDSSSQSSNRLQNPQHPNQQQLNRNPQQQQQNVKKPNPHHPPPQHQDMHPPLNQQAQNVNTYQQKNGAVHPNPHKFPHPQPQQKPHPQQQQRTPQPQSNQNLNKSLPLSQQQQMHKPNQQQSTNVKHPTSKTNGLNQSMSSSNLANPCINIKSEKISENENSKNLSLNANGNKKLNLAPNGLKSSPSTPSSSATASMSSSSSSTTGTSLKRGNEELNTMSSAPNKIPKYVVDQKSAS